MKTILKVTYLSSVPRFCHSSSVNAIRHRLEHLSDMFHDTIEDYLSEIQASPEIGTQEAYR